MENQKNLAPDEKSPSDLDVAEGQRDEVDRALENEDRRQIENLKKEGKWDHKTEVNIH